MARLAERQREDVTHLSTQTNKRGAGNVCLSVFSPLDTISVSEVMSLSSFFIVKQNHNGGDEVNDLSGWKEVDGRSAVSATVTIPV